MERDVASKSEIKSGVCRICGMIYGTTGEHETIVAESWNEQFIVVHIPPGEVEELMWRVFLHLAEAYGFLQKSVCSHANIVTFRGTPDVLIAIRDQMRAVELSAEWINEFDRAFFRCSTSCAPVESYIGGKDDGKTIV